MLDSSQPAPMNSKEVFEKAFPNCSLSAGNQDYFITAKAVIHPVTQMAECKLTLTTAQAIVEKLRTIAEDKGLAGTDITCAPDACSTRCKLDPSKANYAVKIPTEIAQNPTFLEAISSQSSEIQQHVAHVVATAFERNLPRAGGFSTGAVGASRAG